MTKYGLRVNPEAYIYNRPGCWYGGNARTQGGKI